jgi:hypothetical protein
MRIAPWLALATVVFGAGTPVAHAAPAPCFEVAGGRAAGAPTSSHRVTLATELSTRVGCEYALDAAGPWAPVAPGSAGKSDFATLVLDLGAAARSALPRVVYGRVAHEPANKTRATSAKAGTDSAGDAAGESVFLAGCTEYLLSRGRGFEMRVPVDMQRPEVHRLGGQDDCGGALLSLRFVPLADGDASAPPVARRGPWEVTLKPGQVSLALDPGRWGVYATRGEGDAGLYVGRIASASSLTPLRAAFRELAASDGAAPWLQATWARGHLRFEPATAAFAASDVWAELRAAAASGAIWIASQPKVRSQDGATDPASPADAVLGTLALDAGGAAFSVPAAPIEAHMAARYGRAGSVLVPSFADWAGVVDGLALCLAGRYAPAGAFVAGADPDEQPPAPPPETPAPVPQGARCVPFGKFAGPLAERGGRALAVGQICIRRQNRVLTASGVVPGPERGESCAEIPSGPAAGSAPEILLATVGDEITFAGVGAESLFACLGGECRSIPGSGKWLRLDRSGLTEIRHGERPEHARSRLGLALVRIGVIDPGTDWHPTGLYDFDGTPPDNRWTALGHDESEVFTYVRRRQSLRFRLSSAPALAAAWNARAARNSRLTPDLPLVTPAEGEFDAPPASALVVLPTRQAACPNRPAGEVRRDVIEPDALLVDERFHLHLAHYRGEKLPFDCLATAGFRVTENLSWRASPSIRFGVLGDVQAMLFVTRPGAVGLAAPLAYGRWRFGLGAGLDLGASVTSAIGLDGELSRAGLGVSAMVTWGPERIAPRLIGMGLMLHAATGTDPEQEPDATFVASLNLSTLVDMAGGR